MKLSKNLKLNIIFVSILLILGLFYFWLQKPKANLGERIFKISGIEQVNRIEINKNNSRHILIKDNDSWFVKKDDSKLPANEDLVNNLIQELSKEMELEIISENPDKYFIYELDDAQVGVLKLYQDDKLIQELKIGKMATIYPSSFIAFNNDSRVYQVNNNLTFIVNISDWLKSVKEESKNLE